ncbi:MAG: hypothetical protein AUF61_02775 [Chloroflexi bacterium 13_1_20CM_66_33]|nr:MAG: hypothetical protein AUF61_02775 [Chloroflexi bacterium 13_1_20CM_66_33]
MQVDNGVEAGVVQAANIGDDRLPVARAAVSGGRAIDPEPAILVQRKANRIDMPGGHRGDRRRIIGPIEGAAAIHAHVFGARPVDAKQPDRMAAAVNEVVAGHPDGQRHGSGADDRKSRDQGQGKGGRDRHKRKSRRRAAPAWVRVASHASCR